jgi:hypothetical protein
VPALPVRERAVLLLLLWEGLAESMQHVGVVDFAPAAAALDCHVQVLLLPKRASMLCSAR